MYFSCLTWLLTPVSSPVTVAVTVTVTVLPITCGAKPPPSDKYDDQEDVEKAAQE